MITLLNYLKITGFNLVPRFNVISRIPEWLELCLTLQVFALELTRIENPQIAKSKKTGVRLLDFKTLLILADCHVFWRDVNLSLLIEVYIIQQILDLEKCYPSSRLFNLDLIIEIL